MLNVKQFNRARSNMPRFRQPLIIWSLVTMTFLGTYLILPATGLILVIATIFLLWSMPTIRGELLMSAFTIFIFLVALASGIISYQLSLETSKVVHSAAFVLYAIASILFWSNPRRTIKSQDLGSFVGAFFLLAATVSCIFREPNTWFRFATSGDSANVLLFFLEQQVQLGIKPGISSYPVPMVSSILELGIPSGAIQLPARYLMESFASSWILLLVLNTILVGQFVSNRISNQTGRNKIVSSGAASFVPLSWIFAGYPMDYGFINAQVALAVIFAMMISLDSDFITDSRKFSILVSSGLLLLATWAPLVLFPIGLLFYWFSKSKFGNLVADIRARPLLPIVSVVLFVCYTAFFVVPNLIHKFGLLSLPGAIFPIPSLVYVTFALLLGLLICLKIGSAQTNASLYGVVLIGVGVIGSAFLAKGYDWNFSGYYPAKFLWLVSLVGIVVMISILFEHLSVRRSFFRSWLSVSISLFLVIASLVPFEFLPGYKSVPALGQVLGDSRSIKNPNSILKISTFAEQRMVPFYWKTNSPDESFINFWNLQLRSMPMEKYFDRRVVAYGMYKKETVADLCETLEIINLGNFEVLTSDDLLLANGLECPKLNIKLSRSDLSE